MILYTYVNTNLSRRDASSARACIYGDRVYCHNSIYALLLFEIIANDSREFFRLTRLAINDVQEFHSFFITSFVLRVTRTLYDYFKRATEYQIRKREEKNTRC